MQSITDLEEKEQFDKFNEGTCMYTEVFVKSLASASPSMTLKLYSRLKQNLLVMGIWLVANGADCYTFNLLIAVLCTVHLYNGLFYAQSS